MVHSGGCSANDFRDVFKKNIEKRVRSLPEIDGLSKETVLSSWLAKYDAIYRGEEDFCKQTNRMALSAVSELILSKEQLYEMFQQILGIKKLEHQLIYNACQVSIGVTWFCCVQNISPMPTGQLLPLCVQKPSILSTSPQSKEMKTLRKESWNHLIAGEHLEKGYARLYGTYCTEIS